MSPTSLTAFATQQPSPDAIRAGQTRALYQQGLTGTYGNLIVAFVTFVFAASEGVRWWRLLPLAAVVLVYLERIRQVRLYRRMDDDAPLAGLRRRFLLSSLAAGTSWGLSALFLMPTVGSAEQLFVIIVTIGLAAGGLSTLGEVLPVFLSFALPILVLTFLAVLLFFEGNANLIGPLLGLYILVLVKTSVVHARSLQSAIALSLQNAALARNLEEASEKAYAASHAKGEFLARMSHEIRTPMNGVLGTTELLKDAPLPDREHHLAVLAHSSSALLLNLLNDVLDMARIEAGRIDIRTAPMSVEELLDDVATMFAAQADQKGLTLVCHTDGDVPGAIVGDATRLRQVLMNLTGNAVKFTPRGEIEVHASAVERELVLDVRDTGIGIPAEQHEAIFHAFEQVDQAERPRIRGTGLGLAISARLTALMGGRITVESAPDAGSRFTVRVPFELPDGPQPTPRAPTLDGARAVVYAPRRLERDVLVTWLREAGAAVWACADRDALRPLTEGVDVIVVDPGDHDDDALGDILGARRALVLERPSARLGAPCWANESWRPFPLPLQRTRLVRAVAKLRTAQSAAAPSPPPRTPTAEGDVRVLVVDDDAVNRMVASHMLSQLGVDIDTAPDGESALASLAAGDYDLVLLDCELPGIDGAEVSRRVRAAGTASRDGRPVPIVALTAHVLAHHRAACAEAGMDTVLTKPLTVGALGETLSRFGLLDAATPGEGPAPPAATG